MGEGSKKCTKCGEVRLLKEFHRSNKVKSGRRSECVECARVYREANKERSRLYKKEYREINKEQIKIKKKAYRMANKEKISDRNKVWRAANCEEIKERKKYYRTINRAFVNNKKREYYRENRKDILRNWKQNKHKWRGSIVSSQARYRAKKLNAYPSWADKGLRLQIRKVYDNCPEGYQVDHIVPLQGRNVSGLHVPWNLQYLTVKENMSKGNKFDQS